MGREAPGFEYHPQLGTGAKLPAHCPWVLTLGLTPALLERKRVETGAELGSRPHSSQGTKHNHHQSLPCAPHGQQPLRRAKKAAQGTPAHFPSPPCTPPLSFWGPQCAHSMTRSPLPSQQLGTHPTQKDLLYQLQGQRALGPTVG